MINKVFLIGNVGADPVIRCFENGNNVAKFRLVTTERFTGKDGQRKEINEWHNVEAWGQPAAIIDQYVRKGDRLFVEGQIHYEEYKDKTGVTRYQTVIRLHEVKMLTSKPSKPNEPAGSAASPQPQQAPMPEPPQVPMPPMADVDELPF